MIRDMEGIDVHGDKGLIDWAKVAASGRTFAFVKASEGATFVDKRITQNLEQARLHDILVGPYHYARPDNRSQLAGARLEAETFCAVLVASGYDEKIHARPVLDIEVGSGNLSPWAYTFCAWVEELLDVTPMIYSYTYFIREHLMGRELARFPLWLANYGINDGVRHVILAGVGPWSAWAVHQYTSNGAVPGVSGRVDCNFSVSLDPLRAFLPEGSLMWQWIRWRRGHGEYKLYGPKNPAMRPDVPERIPAAWWARFLLNMGIHPLGGRGGKSVVQ